MQHKEENATFGEFPFSLSGDSGRLLHHILSARQAGTSDFLEDFQKLEKCPLNVGYNRNMTVKLMYLLKLTVNCAPTAGACHSGGWCLALCSHVWSQ